MFSVITEFSDLFAICVIFRHLPRPVGEGHAARLWRAEQRPFRPGRPPEAFRPKDQHPQRLPVPGEEARGLQGRICAAGPQHCQKYRDLGQISSGPQQRTHTQGITPKLNSFLASESSQKKAKYISVRVS